jgi:DNA-binding IclR family transcriptional regulator
MQSHTRTRRDQQRRIAALLDELEQRRRRLYALKAGGARPAGLRDLKADLRAAQDELAAALAVTAGPQPATAACAARGRMTAPRPATLAA